MKIPGLKSLFLLFLCSLIALPAHARKIELRAELGTPVIEAGLKQKAFLKISTGIVIALGLLLQGTAVANSTVDKQRELFRQVYADVERGNWDAVETLGAEDRALLRKYVLWPDLRAAFFRATLSKADHDEVESFLARHGILRPARDLRYRYALHLAAIGDLDAYFTIYSIALMRGVGSGQVALLRVSTPDGLLDRCFGTTIGGHVEEVRSLTSDAECRELG